jgi:hypothetical protein
MQAGKETERRTEQVQNTSGNDKRSVRHDVSIDGKMRRFGLLIFIILFFASSLFFPLSGLFGLSTVRPDDAGPFPETIDLMALEDWYAKNYPLRSGAISVYNAVLARALKTSGSSRVVVGREGWLYFADALPVESSEITAERLSGTVSILKRSFEQRGVRFIFMPVPNKSSIYPEYLPRGYEIKTPSLYDHFYAQNKTAFGPDLKTYFLKEKERFGDILYRMNDSHWSDFGAALAVDLVTGCGVTGEDIIFQRRTGDLSRMLFPALQIQEDVACPAVAKDYFVENELYTPDDMTIRTKGEGTKNFLIYRDSFGRALIVPFASATRSAVFSRELPYRDDEVTSRLSGAGSVDTVIFQIAERNLEDLLVTAPLVTAPEVRISELEEDGVKIRDAGTAAELGIKPELVQNNPDAIFFPYERRQDETKSSSGLFSLEGDERIFVDNGTIVVEAFCVFGERPGFSVRFPEAQRGDLSADAFRILTGRER